MRAICLLLACWSAVSSAAAQTVVTSREPQAVAVTLYRDPQRGDGPMDAKWPRGYALITETRTVHLPAGRFVLRFEGVAEGMMPETAIVTGLPQAVNEKNRDARLLLPASLVNAYLKRRVTIRRTDRATGKVTTGEAVIEAGPGQGVVLTTVDGVEALGCSGLPEAVTYPAVPADLSLKPVLSVVADSAREMTATVQLSYLSQGFDWSAHYVATLAEDGRTVDLFAWLTVANGGSQGFADAHTQAVAGRLNKERNVALPASPLPALHLQCWPMDITSTHPRIERPVSQAIEAIVAQDIGGFADKNVAESLSRVQGLALAAPAPPPMIAQQEELGDLKLYRVPEPVNVAAMGQKQVAMIDRRKVRFERIYTANVNNGLASFPATLVLRADNREGQGLGLPLPAGGVAIFQRRAGTPLLLGEANLADRAIGDEVELPIGPSTDVQVRVTPRPPTSGRAPYQVEVSNARATPVTFELMLPLRVEAPGADLTERKGQKAWRIQVPANGTAKIDFTWLRK